MPLQSLPPQSMQQAQHMRREGTLHHSNAVFSAGFVTRFSHQVLRHCGKPLPIKQAMYACILETGCGFFEGVCTPSNTTAHSCDPPLPLTLRELTLATAGWSKDERGRQYVICPARSGRRGATP